MAVVLFSAVYFLLFGTENWRILALLWAVVPAANSILFMRVPIYSLLGEGERGLSLKELLKNRIFWLLLLLMICAGASEQAVSQWASTVSYTHLDVYKRQQYESVLLNSYVAGGGSWGLDARDSGVFVLPPREKADANLNVYRGTADAISQNIDFVDSYDPEYILILSGEDVYKRQAVCSRHTGCFESCAAVPSDIGAEWNSCCFFRCLCTGAGRIL